MTGAATHSVRDGHSACGPGGRSSVASSPAVSTRVYVETGVRTVFACALDWPGWCRHDRSEDAAIERLAAYAPRYRRVAARAGMQPGEVATARLTVVERLAGSTTTDFGAPDAVAAADLAPLDAAATERMVSLLQAAWAELDAVVAAAPLALRLGPRGGGRDRDAMVSHVTDAERSYARKVGVRLTAAEWKSGGVVLMRERLRVVLRRPWPGGDPGERAWPPAYLVRRTAWHALDHAWEIEDRTEPAP